MTSTRFKIAAKSEGGEDTRVREKIPAGFSLRPEKIRGGRSYPVTPARNPEFLNVFGASKAQNLLLLHVVRAPRAQNLVVYAL